MNVSRLGDDEQIADIALQKYFLNFFFINIIFIFYSFSSVDRVKVYYHLSLEVLAILMILQEDLDISHVNSCLRSSKVSLHIFRIVHAKMTTGIPRAWIPSGS